MSRCFLLPVYFILNFLSVSSYVSQLVPFHYPLSLSFISNSTCSYSYCMIVSGGTVFEEEVSAVQKEVDKLIEEGIDKIIGLGHSGYQKDLEVAANVRGIDLIVGGHTDTFLYTGK